MNLMDSLYDQANGDEIRLSVCSFIKNIWLPLFLSWYNYFFFVNIKDGKRLYAYHLF